MVSLTAFVASSAQWPNETLAAVVRHLLRMRGARSAIECNVQTRRNDIGHPCLFPGAALQVLGVGGFVKHFGFPVRRTVSGKQRFLVKAGDDVVFRRH